MKTITTTCLLAVLASLAGTAGAEEASPVTANLTLTSKYKYRGQDQANTEAVTPAVQGGFDYSNSGFYVGNWNSSIGFTNSGLEMDFYGGYKGSITKDLGYDVGVLQYYYPQQDKVVDFNTTEIYGAMSFGPASAKLSYTVSDKYFGIEGGKGTLYGDLSANFELIPKLTLNLHVGGTSFDSEAKDNGAANYWDYKVGLTYDIGAGFSAAGAYVGGTKTDHYGDINKGRLIVSITKSM
ncbi:MAG TPA: TorF family putative porin [Rhizobacter sp.]|nr:TorF family putative porin [Rhizobacter sp.]